MQLVIPSLQYKDAYLQALEEAKNETGETQLNKPEDGQSFAEFVQKLKDNAEGINLPPGYVPATMLWLIDNDDLIGRVHIRHTLTEDLMQHGGHIGYYVRPTKRKKGYGKRMLELALKEARKLGLVKVLITCDDNNIGSIKIIEANGGILENILDTKGVKHKTRRYWINL